jgi:hypothetical protein
MGPHATGGVGAEGAAQAACSVFILYPWQAGLVFGTAEAIVLPPQSIDKFFICVKSI